VIGLYLAGIPNPKDDVPNPGYDFMLNMTPSSWLEISSGGKGRFWWSLSSIAILTSACHLSGVRHAFSTRLCRYLGKISFMLYLTHTLILNNLGQPMRSFIYSRTGRKSLDRPIGSSPMHEISTFLIYVLLHGTFVAMALALAHLGQLLVDEPSVRLAKKFEQFFTGCSKAQSNTQEASLYTTSTPISVPHAEMEHLLTHITPVSPEQYRDGEDGIPRLSVEIVQRPVRRQPPDSQHSNEEEVLPSLFADTDLHLSHDELVNAERFV
jgi:hypothetical protein